MKHPQMYDVREDPRKVEKAYLVAVETATGETEERAGLYFRPVHVFDVGQTDGEELPEVDVPRSVLAYVARRIKPGVIHDQ